MFYNQPIAHRFGTALADDVEGTQWTCIEIAVAWVRRSGTKHIKNAFQGFLARGGFAQVTVGVDIENTSAEGLEDLLALEAFGGFETHIYHNETASTFHPKVYLFRNTKDARLIVGSNNLTEAGLFINTEAGLQVDAPLSDPLVTDVRTALAAWRDTSTGLAKRLDRTLLDDLVRLGYVLREADLQKRRKASSDAGKVRRGAITAPPLFKAQKYFPPPARGPVASTAAVPGTVLLMRVRRASETARRTQIQIPIRVVKTKFFAGVRAITSAHDARTHALVSATARGGLNTIKTEIPEIERINDPVLRMERTTSGIVYRAFDAKSVMGAPIRTALMNGFALSPPATFTSIADRTRATWWRFI